MSPAGGSGGGDADAYAEELVTAAHELYGLPPTEFTAERDRRAKVVRSSDRALSDAIKAFKRPTVPAWAVNLLVREEADLVRQVLDIGEALREAQEGLEGDALRELGKQRRELIASVVARARALVRDEGAKLNDQAEQQVAATLQAALADPTAAEAVLGGLLVKPLESTGLGSVDVADHVAVPPGGPPPPKAAAPKRRKPTSDEEAQQAELRERAEERRRLKREAAQQRVSDAEQALGEAEQALHDVRRQREEAQAHLLHLEARIDELRRQLADLEQEAETASDQVDDLEQQVTDADGEVEEAEDELSEARKALSELD